MLFRSDEEGRVGRVAASGHLVRQTVAALEHDLAALRDQHGALEPVHPVIITDFLVVIPFAGAVFAQTAGAGGVGGVVGDQGAAFAVGAEVLAGIETEPGKAPELPDAFALVSRSVGLRGILDDPAYLKVVEDQGGLVVTDATCFGTRIMWKGTVLRLMSLEGFEYQPKYVARISSG